MCSQLKRSPLALLVPVAAFSFLVRSSRLTQAAPQTSTSDPQAIAILTQAVTAAEGAQALTSSPIQDFTATGNITYYWAGEQVQGSVTLKGRGTQQFRIDANLPAGTRSYAITYGGGQVKDTSGVITPIPYHDTVNVGVLSFPYLVIAADLADPTLVASYVGLVDNAQGGQFQQVRVQHQSTPDQDPGGYLAKLRVIDYFVDPVTGLVAKTVDMTHPYADLAQNYSHEVDFQNYATINGIHVPMMITEKITDQTLWQAQLSGISFNTGLTDQDFVLQ